MMQWRTVGGLKTVCSLEQYGSLLIVYKCSKYSREIKSLKQNISQTYTVERFLYPNVKLMDLHFILYCLPFQERVLLLFAYILITQINTVIFLKL